MPNGKHLTLSDRISIEAGMKEGRSFKRIAAELGKDPSTISKEVRAHIIVSEKKDTYNPCLHRKECSHNSDICEQCSYRWGHPCNRCRGCYTHCPDYEEQSCSRLLKPPYVCLGCEE